jgi:hypothetical protein
LSRKIVDDFNCGANKTAVPLKTRRKNYHYKKYPIFMYPEKQLSFALLKLLGILGNKIGIVAK